ncbi:DUF2169 domain-containing protein [uncultured Paracoccus sp.]|uniref:DUF2169 family type VI secretion system accessory protein n=1 Tax=uncultured Paracoccus sp. TaxID=189685 RepID=UPI002618075E|nr:DUF2169 domain-containing protein [uncultured Paracoccus sp.]
MELLNPTPLPGLAFRQFDQNGDLDCVVTLRGTFEHVQDGPARWVEDQMPLQWQDAYAGDPHETSMLHQGDLVPGKTGTDVTYLGGSYAPGGAAARWSCAMEIGPVRKTLHVSGPRDWRPVVRPARWPLRREDEVMEWRLGDPQPASAVDLDWRLAAGGREAFGAGEADAMNPLGCGRIGPREAWQARSVPAPQIGDEPNPRPSDPPAGFGPLPPFWPQRARHAGTYDEAWQAERHPLLPLNFDPRFWQCAPEDQIARPFLKGDEAYLLTNLHPHHPSAAGRLPGVTFAVLQEQGDWLPLDLDGVQFDWRDRALILLTWRARFPLPEADGVKLHLAWRWSTHAEAA